MSWWIEAQRGDRQAFYRHLAEKEAARLRALGDDSRLNAVAMAMPRRTRRQRQQQQDEEV